MRKLWGFLKIFVLLLVAVPVAFVVAACGSRGPGPCDNEDCLAENCFCDVCECTEDNQCEC